MSADRPSDAGLVSRLREPIDHGGYDGWGADPLHVLAADAIEFWHNAHDTQQTMHAAWRKRAEEAESRTLPDQEDAILRLNAHIAELLRLADIAAADVVRETDRAPLEDPQ